MTFDRRWLLKSAAAATAAVAARPLLTSQVCAFDWLDDQLG
ncbi:MAG: hypothetical protein PSX37_07600 [bacterium]|nr:hypothetical protein [bacterium]